MEAMRVFERDGTVFVKNGKPGYMRPVVFGEDFFLSITDLAKKTKIPRHQVQERVKKGKGLDGKEIRYATKEEVVAMVGEPVQKRTKRKVNHPVRVMPKQSPVETPSEFLWEGVVWPDGSITVKLTGKSFSLTRSCMNEIPEEIRACCMFR